jgi:hypothetical protein
MTQPYHREPSLSFPGIEHASQDGGVPIYLDGFAYSGILNIQDIFQKWP